MSAKKKSALPALEAVVIDKAHRAVKPLRIVFTRHTDRVTTVRATSRHVFTGSEDGTAKQFVIETGVCTFQ